MNIYEFKKYIDTNNIEEVYYSTENQDGFDPLFDLSRLSLTFTEIKVFCEPSLIALKNEKSSLTLTMIKEIHVNPSGYDSFVTLATIVCKNPLYYNEPEQIYTLSLVSKKENICHEHLQV